MCTVVHFPLSVGLEFPCRRVVSSVPSTRQHWLSGGPGAWRGRRSGLVWAGMKGNRRDCSSPPKVRHSPYFASLPWAFPHICVPSQSYRVSCSCSHSMHREALWVSRLLCLPLPLMPLVLFIVMWYIGSSYITDRLGSWLSLRLIKLWLLLFFFFMGTVLWKALSFYVLPFNCFLKTYKKKEVLRFRKSWKKTQCEGAKRENM